MRTILAWYSKARWLRMAKAQLRDHPLCAYCLQRGKYVPARICDHVIPHKGNEELFWNGALQSLCKHCHDSAKQLEEIRGYRNDIGLDGWPVDPRHPANSHKF